MWGKPSCASPRTGRRARRRGRPRLRGNDGADPAPGLCVVQGASAPGVLGGGAGTVRVRRAHWQGCGSLMTRCQMGGTRTVLTRRPGRGWPVASQHPVPVGRHSGGDVAVPRPLRLRIRQHPVPARRHSDGHDKTHSRRVGERVAVTRCPRGGTQTVLTRRPGRSGQGYVSTRCRRSGTQDGHAAPRRLTRRRVGHDPVPSAGWRCHRG